MPWSAHAMVRYGTRHGQVRYACDLSQSIPTLGLTLTLCLLLVTIHPNMWLGGIRLALVNVRMRVRVRVQVRVKVRVGVRVRVRVPI